MDTKQHTNTSEKNETNKKIYIYIYIYICISHYLSLYVHIYKLKYIHLMMSPEATPMTNKLLCCTLAREREGDTQN